jgi:hypothetical protein
MTALKFDAGFERGVDFEAKSYLNDLRCSGIFDRSI